MSEPPKVIDHAAERRRLLDKFDMITEEELAVLLDVTVKTLKNRDQRDLPSFSKVGNKRLFFKADVIKYLRRRNND
jgi:phage terminase Nu1 subunit (DNA packaging protein)